MTADPPFQVGAVYVTVSCPVAGLATAVLMLKAQLLTVEADAETKIPVDGVAPLRLTELVQLLPPIAQWLMVTGEPVPGVDR